MYEHKSMAVLPRQAFLRRVAGHVFFSSCLVAVSLGIGVMGYHGFENLPWIDSLLNAAMLLGGMGPVDRLQTDAGKLFASFYALFAGLILIAAVSVIFAPIYHRILHKFHAELDTKEES